MKDKQQKYEEKPRAYPSSLGIGVCEIMIGLGIISLVLILTLV